MPNPPGVLRRALGYAAAFPGLGGGTLLLLLAGSGLAMTGPLIIRRIVDDGISARDFSSAGFWSLVYLAAELVRSGIEASQNYLLRAWSRATAARIRADVFAQVQRLPLRWFEGTPAAEAAARSTNEVAAVGEALSAGLVGVLRDGLVLAVVAALVVTLRPRFGLMVVALSVLAAIPAILFRRTAMRRSSLALEAATSMNTVLEENVSGSLVIRLFGLENERGRRFRHENDRALDVAISTLRSRVLFDGGATISTAVALTLILGLGGAELAEGRITPGIFVAFVQYGSYLLGSLRGLSEKTLAVLSGVSAGERVFSTLESARIPSADAVAGDLPRDSGALSAEQLHFGYDTGKEVLRGVSLHMEAGTRVALVGKTGAGKTTLARLLARLYDPRSGTVRLAGRDLRTMEEGELRRRIVYVTQQISLFRESVLENVRMGDPRIARSEVMEACRALNADRFVERLPGAYDALLGEGGHHLSAGQRQLLSFARVFVRKPDVLILDEPTAHVDPETEAIILQAMNRLLGRTTSVVIAHRHSTLQGSDRILLMKEGRLEELSSNAWRDRLGVPDYGNSSRVSS